MTEKEMLSTINKVLCNKTMTNQKNRVKSIINICTKYLENITPEEYKVITGTSNVPKLETDLLKLNTENIPLEKYDVVKTLIGTTYNYAIIYKIDIDFNTAWVVPLTTDCNISMAMPIGNNSRIFRNCYYLPYFAPVFLSTHTHFISTFDNKKLFDKIVKIIIYYLKTNFKK